MVDIIIPAYNCEKTLECTVESLIKSGLPNYNIIIVDDGSTDSTARVCEKLSEKYGNVNYIRKANGGVSSARNEGILRSQADYVLFFDSDDTVDENSFSEIENLLAEHSPDMLVFGMTFDYYKNGKCYRSDDFVYEKGGSFSQKEISDDLTALYDANVLSSSCNKFIKRTLICDNGIKYNENMIILEDLMFSLELFEKSEKIYFLKKPIYRYRQSENENHAFKRLEKIEDLAKYMTPIKKQLEKISTDKGKELSVRIYFMLLYQKLYRSDLVAIKKENELFLKSEYTDDGVRVYLGENEKRLFDNLKKKNAKSIYLENTKTQLRHKIAVGVKSIING